MYGTYNRGTGGEEQATVLAAYMAYEACMQHIRVRTEMRNEEKKRRSKGLCGTSVCRIGGLHGRVAPTSETSGTGSIQRQGRTVDGNRRLTKALRRERVVHRSTNGQQVQVEHQSSSKGIHRDTKERSKLCTDNDNSDY